jgi:hypothetical protein
MSMLIGPGVTVNAVGAVMLTVTLSVAVETLPATSVALTTTELDTEKSGTVQEKLEPLSLAVVALHGRFLRRPAHHQHPPLPQIHRLSLRLALV